MITPVLLLIVILATLAIYLNDLLLGAICLAGVSALLSWVIYQFGMPYAAVFELSVAAGLITVLFISTISLVKPAGQSERELGLEAGNPSPLPRLFEEDAREGKALKRLPLVVAILAILLWELRESWPSIRYAPAFDAPFAETLWHIRTVDLFGQITIILCGVFLVVHFFKERAS